MHTRSIEVVVGSRRFRLTGVPVRRVQGVEAVAAADNDRIAVLTAQAIIGTQLVDAASIRFVASVLPRDVSRAVQQRLGDERWEASSWGVWVREARRYLSASLAVLRDGAWELPFEASAQHPVAANG